VVDIEKKSDMHLRVVFQRKKSLAGDAPAGICSTLDPWSFEMAIFLDVRFPEEKGPSWGCNRTLAARDVERQAPAGIWLHA
jgi:hypothetical protein